MNIDDFNEVCVVGWGASGIGLVNLLLSLGKKVKVSEQRERNCFSPEVIDSLVKAGVDFEFSAHSESFIKQSQLVVLSPGVDPVRSKAIKAILSLGLPYIGEIEFAFLLTKANCIAITGTNGKTTTSHLTYQLLKAKRKRVFLGGNVGIPFSSFVLNTKKGDLVVLELSSFQLETIISFRPQVAALLNVAPDHLDRYKDFREYLTAKMNIFRNQTKEDFAVLNKNSSLNFEKEGSVKAKTIYFSNEFSDENLSAAYRIAQIYGLTKLDCEKVFSSFVGLPHRRQLVKVINGINFVNDSKATNPSSTIWALKNSKGSVILLAGGKDKGLDYSELVPYLKSVKKLNLFGEASGAIMESLEAHVPVQKFSSFEEAIAVSFSQASQGDTILLSPMCSSFDMFSNYKERGDRFSAIVNSF
ncbi:MAG: UDP-N-acetylmuramoyl-L-alanine--D-glutamate ligase [Candidatus Omnitrophica bacterium]|nr:UDP-N-acetylmuramoyl-L-alanine--D-glutamate ligase [Candidatus Omnitrophota bacterium]